MSSLGLYDHFLDVLKRNKWEDQLNAFAHSSTDASYHSDTDNNNPSDNNKHNNDNKNDNNNDHREKYLDLHYNIAFVGFPSTTVKALKERWFNTLDKDDKILESIGINRELFHAPGKISARYHFHVVHTSFHLADVLRDYVNALLRPLHPRVTTQAQAQATDSSGNGTKEAEKAEAAANTNRLWYLNTKELELALSELTLVRLCCNHSQTVASKTAQQYNIYTTPLL
jgi:hypothetical protein